MMDGISHGEITEVEDVSLPETSKAVDPRWTDWIHTLNRLNKLSEALLPAEFNPFKAKEDEKSRESAGGSDDHHMPASDVTVAHCSCQINSAVVKEWKSSIRFNRMKLMGLLKEYPCLLAIHGSTGDTVLHAAAREGNLKLLAYTCSLFLDDHGNAVKEYVHGDNKIDRKAFFEKKNDDQFTAKDCLLFTLPGTTVYAYFDNFVKSGKFDASNKIDFRNASTLISAMQDEVFNPFYDDERKRLNNSRDGIYEDNHGGVDAKRRMKYIIIREYNERKEQLDQNPPTGSDLIAEYEELRFLHTLSGRRYKAVKEEYLRAVIRGCVEQGPDVVKYLFSHRNAKGQTAFHCANVRYCAMLIEEIPPGDEFKDCYNARDVRDWTALHCATAKGDEDKVECLLKGMRVDVNAEMFEEYSSERRRNGVALHLAIMHDHVKVVRILLQRKDTNVNALYNSDDYNMGWHIQYKDSKLKQWTPLQLAVFLGRHEIIKALLHHPKVDDPGVQKGKTLWPFGVQFCQNANDEKSNSNEELLSMFSAIHSVGIMGDPKILLCFLNISMFDLSVTNRGCIALHFVLDGTTLTIRRYDRLLKKSYFHGQHQYGTNVQINPPDMDRKACVAILIEGGLDMWQRNDERRFPEPGLGISLNLHDYWQQMRLSETQHAKNNLNVVGNAVSVVSALVATASYVGPLQPPLGLDPNFVQDGSLPIRIYMITNTLSFYFAFASILYAMVPSLPMSREGLYEEWQRSKKTIVIAIHLLLAAVLNILISFGAASNVVVSSEYSWQRKGLVFYPTLLGGLLCMLALSSFYKPLWRYSIVKNPTIKRVYRRL